MYNFAYQSWFSCNLIFCPQTPTSFCVLTNAPHPAVCPHILSPKHLPMPIMIAIFVYTCRIIPWKDVLMGPFRWQGRSTLTAKMDEVSIFHSNGWGQIIEQFLWMLMGLTVSTCMLFCVVVLVLSLKNYPSYYSFCVWFFDVIMCSCFGLHFKWHVRTQTVHDGIIFILKNTVKYCLCPPVGQV